MAVMTLQLPNRMKHAPGGAVVVLGLSAFAAQAQFHPDYASLQAEAERGMALRARTHERELREAMLAGRSALAHARLSNSGRVKEWTGALDAPAMCHAIESPETFVYTTSPGQRGYPLWSAASAGPAAAEWLVWQDVAPEGEPLESLYSDYISGPIVQTKCVACHVDGRLAQAPVSRLQFSVSSVEDYVALNRAVFEDFVAVLERDGQVEDPVTYILNKVSGAIAHTGGNPVPAGEADYANLERFLRALEEKAGSTPPGLTPETLFEGVTMASPARTLHRAAILFAGRLPTDAEFEAVSDGQDASLRQAIRGLMAGPGFHDFLIRASNDRLLTDRQFDQGVIDADSIEFVGLNRKQWEMAHGAESRGNWLWGDPEYRQWHNALSHGLVRAPLELIAHVVENDIPYTEILTADYIMANPATAQAYGAATQFDNPNDYSEFKPSEIVSYYRNDSSKIVAYHSSLGNVVLNPGNLLTDYPHAGILNTTAFLRRYPSTATNRNRLRSRWTYYHFLGEDIEKTSSRTTDATALLDPDNPTMNNQDCAACHSVLDPVAGAFQNYGNQGLYRDQWGGKNSLDPQYREGVLRASTEYFTINSRSWEDRETFSFTRSLGAGKYKISLARESRQHIHADYLTIRGSGGNTVAHFELENSTDEECGNNWTDGGESYEIIHCPLVVPVEVPGDGEYEIETAASVGYDPEEHLGRPATMAVSVSSRLLYQEGDTWYRDMRSPGLGVELVPNPDNSVQWLAHRIAADDRFAEAAVKFWWQPIMGVDLLDLPGSGGAVGADAQSLAAAAQAVAVTRLAQWFRTGFAGGSAYNAKDLLTELAMTPWFRAQSYAGDDQMRAAALRDAGVSRLLTPEELNRKTEAVADYVWGRYFRQTGGPGKGYPRSNLEERYERLYGGIDSAGIISRANEMTPVMAAVAQSHAAEVSCPVVRREFFFWEDGERRLFDGIGQYDTPVSETYRVFDVSVDTWDTRATYSLEVPLLAGSKTISLGFENEYWDGPENDRNLNLDRLTVRDSEGAVVAERELESYGSGPGCGPRAPSDSYYVFWGDGCTLDVSLDVFHDGIYHIDIVAHQDRAGDEAARMSVAVESEDGVSAGSTAIRNKLVDLHRKLYGIDVAPDSTDVNEAFNLFFEIWSRKRLWEGRDFDDSRFQCDSQGDHAHFDGLVDDAFEYHEWGDSPSYLEWDRLNDYFRTIDMRDPEHTVRAWVVTLVFLMTDYRYLYY